MQIDDAREFIKFLHGAVPWNGTWFGEYAPGERGAYWWRKHLDEAIAALIAAPAAPQQAEPVAQIGWADEFGNMFPMGAWKPAQRTHHDAHKTAWRAVYLHPPAAEVQQAEPAISVNVLQASDGSWILQVPEYFPKLSAGWHDLYLHPPADEVQRLRDAAKRVTAAQSGSAFAINESINALRRALEGGE